MMWQLDPVDLSMYGAYYPPTFAPEPFLLVQCWTPEQAHYYYKWMMEQPCAMSGVHNDDGSARIDTHHRSSQYICVDANMAGEIQQRLDFVLDFHTYPKLGRKFRLAEPLQFLRYDEEHKGHFLRHTDDGYFSGPGKFIFTSSHRKLSVVAYLNDDYEGGQLELPTVRDDNGFPFCHRMAAGSMIIFPSDQRFPHEVHPVTQGHRVSVVGWYDFA